MADNERDEMNLRFLPSVERDYRNLPEGIRRILGRALNLVQHSIEPRERLKLTEQDAERRRTGDTQ